MVDDIDVVRAVESINESALKLKNMVSNGPNISATVLISKIKANTAKVEKFFDKK